MSEIGLAIMILGLFIIVARLTPHPAAADIIWRVVVCGFGSGLFQAPNNRATIASTPHERSGKAGAGISAAQLLGRTTGRALVTPIFRPCSRKRNPPPR